MKTDPYRSRTGGPVAMAPRPDPVVWGDRPGPLTGAQLRSYLERGFLVLDAWIDDPDGMLREARRLARSADALPVDEVIREPGDERSVRSIFRVHAHSEALGGQMMNPALADIARQLLGSQVYVHQSRINFKPAFTGKPFLWHSDFETWHVEDGMPRPRAVSASVMLTDSTPHNGPLMFVPGSHRTYVRCPGDTPDDHFRQSLRDQRHGVPTPDALARLIERGGIDLATGRAGTVVFFDCNLMHGSNANLAPTDRVSLFAVYNSVENPLGEPYGGTVPRPDFLASRQVR